MPASSSMDDRDPAAYHDWEGRLAPVPPRERPVPLRVPAPLGSTRAGRARWGVGGGGAGARVARREGPVPLRVPAPLDSTRAGQARRIEFLRGRGVEVPHL